uniref:ABC transporter domain-containing protein n=1 Tax=Chenopodium quinoa TaxID=63459 RepID=A0A803N0E5_CHEQI
MMDKVNSTMGLVRTKSDQLVESMAAAMAAMKSPPSGDGSMVPTADGSRKSSRRITSPGVNSSSRNYNNNTHIRKTRSAQLKLDIDDLCNGAALSRASSASLGLSFSFTGFSVPPEDIADSKPFSDDDIPEDLEAGTRKKRLKAEPTFQIHLKFKEVTYKVVLKGFSNTEEKQVLHGITGSVDPGEVLALMGPSGSGKTTLLNVLGGRIGFVTQDDVLYPHLTVRETLTYAAYLRLPKKLTKKEKEQRAMDVICELGLERCQDTMIGGSFVRGVSGGERKRVCIGNEILINPSLLFLDEPTSGLDSTTALRIIQVLQDIAEDGKTVITTIHQPSSRLFHKFDKLILLGKGSLLYFGKASNVMSYFATIGCTPLISMNPAEFLLDLANGNINDVTVPSELDDKVHMDDPETEKPNGKPSAAVIHDASPLKYNGVTFLTICTGRELESGITEDISYKTSLQYLVESYESRVAEKEKRKLGIPISINEEMKLKLSSVKREWGASWFQQYSILFKRGIKERRHEYFSWLRVTQVLATAVVLGLLWWQSDSKTEKGLEDQAGLLFFIAVFWGFFPVSTAIFAFPQERAMLQKERAADMYRLSAYFLARTTSDLPLDLVLPVLFLIVVYFMAGLRLDAGTFFLTVLTVFLCIVAAQGLGLAIGASLMDIKKATTLGSVTVMAFMLAGGYFVKKVPIFISWIRYLSFNYHTYRLLLKVHYENHIQPTNWMKFDSGLMEVGALIAMVFGYRLLAYIALRRMRLQ